jgi:4-hydroxy-2-oxoheptanedioate aldolase
MIRANKVKEKLAKGEVVLGTFVKITDPSVVEILGLCGLDFFVLDNEHVSMSRESMRTIVRSADVTDIVPIVRVRENKEVEILQALDSGYLGVQVPNVDSLEDARRLVDSVKYTPLGNRGFSPTTRAAYYGLMEKDIYVQKTNDNTLIVSHCETVKGIENLEAILTLEQVDVIFIGPMDLSQSLGVIGQANHALVEENIDKIIVRVKRAGKAVGIACSLAQAPKYIEKGVQYLVIGTDQGMIVEAAKNIVKSLN